MHYELWSFYRRPLTTLQQKVGGISESEDWFVIEEEMSESHKPRDITRYQQMFVDQGMMGE